MIVSGFAPDSHNRERLPTMELKNHLNLSYLKGVINEFYRHTAS